MKSRRVKESIERLFMLIGNGFEDFEGRAQALRSWPDLLVRAYVQGVIPHMPEEPPLGRRYQPSQRKATLWEVRCLCFERLFMVI